MAAQMRGRKEDNMSEVTTFGHGEFIERIAAYLSGCLEGAERTLAEGLSKYVVLRQATISVEDSMRRAPELLARAAEDVVSGWRSTG